MKNKLGLIIAMLFSGCATMNYALQHTDEIKQQRRQEELYRTLDELTRTDQLHLVIDYTHTKMREHPKQYKREIDQGLQIALEIDPLHVYFVSREHYASFSNQDLDAMIHGIEQLKRREEGGIAEGYKTH